VPSPPSRWSFYFVDRSSRGLRVGGLLAIWSAGGGQVAGGAEGTSCRRATSLHRELQRVVDCKRGWNFLGLVTKVAPDTLSGSAVPPARPSLRGERLHSGRSRSLSRICRRGSSDEVGQQRVRLRVSDPVSSTGVTRSHRRRCDYRARATVADREVTKLEDERYDLPTRLDCGHS
jgi:hypothetical protein